MPRDASVTEGRFLAFCEDYARTNGRAPTVREVMDGVGVQSPNGASRALRKHGQITYDKAFAHSLPEGLDPQLLQRLQELQNAAAEVGLAELARERAAFEAIKLAKDKEVEAALADRDAALKQVETTQHERALFEARTGEEIAAKQGQIAALTHDLTAAQKRREEYEQTLSQATATIAETQALLRQAKASAAQQLLEAEERHEAALKQQAGAHEAEKRKLAADLVTADRERRRAEDNRVIAETKLGIAEKTAAQLRRQVEAAQGHVTARAVAEQATLDAQARAVRAEGETAQLRAAFQRVEQTVARLQAENDTLQKLLTRDRSKQSGDADSVG
jgi:chromosome segregation ATPase